MSNYVNLLDIIYPVGSVYISINNASPAEIVGGTWEQVIGKFLRSADVDETSLLTGGVNEHCHTVRFFYPEYYGWGNITANELSMFPSAGIGDVSHKYATADPIKSNLGLGWYVDRLNRYNTGDEVNYPSMNYISTVMSSNTASIKHTYVDYQNGSTSTDSNLPPYINVYVYYRTA